MASIYGSFGEGEGEGEGEGYGEGASIGYGLSFRGVPAGLGYLPWAPDFTPDSSGKPDLPSAINGTLVTGDYLYGDSQLDPPLRAVAAAAEFAAQANTWKNFDGTASAWHCTWNDVDTGIALTLPGLQDTWHTDVNFVTQEIERLLQLMSDDRARYMPEILAQINGAPRYFLSAMGISVGRKPWTQALMTYALRAGEFVAIHYKRSYARVRPSALCRGLLPPFGPPAHPSLPSAHSLQGHLKALLLLQIPGIDQRFGSNGRLADKRFDPARFTALRQEQEINTFRADTLLWVANRIAKNRERAGVHYRSDTVAGRQLAVSAAKFLMDTVQADWAALLGKTQAQIEALDVHFDREDWAAIRLDLGTALTMPEFFKLLYKANREWKVVA